jgi:alpha-beta hydrolase superfamily lysophospholipase
VLSNQRRIAAFSTQRQRVANLPVVDPVEVHAPVPVIRGEYGGIATEAGLLNFFRQLPNEDRRYVSLPGIAHSVATAKNRHMFWHAMRSFLDMPAAVSIEKAG